MDLGSKPGDFEQVGANTLDMLPGFSVLSLRVIHTALC